mgnify:CR=1 FL=1
MNMAGGEDASVAAAAAAGGGGAGGARPLERQKSKVRPKGEVELQLLLDETVAAERRAESLLEESEAKLVADAQAKLEAALVDSDFGWMRQTRRAAAANPRTTRTSSFYDLSRGALGSQEGGPQWLEGRGKWLFVKHGGLRCLKCWPSTFLVLRVPFRKNGGGTHLNACARARARAHAFAPSPSAQRSSHTSRFRPPTPDPALPIPLPAPAPRRARAPPQVHALGAPQMPRRIVTQPCLNGRVGPVGCRQGE